MISTFSPDDVFHLYNFGNLVCIETWHVQIEVAFMHVLNYSYHSYIVTLC